MSSVNQRDISIGYKWSIEYIRICNPSLPGVTFSLLSSDVVAKTAALAEKFLVEVADTPMNTRGGGMRIAVRAPMATPLRMMKSPALIFERME